MEKGIVRALVVLACGVGMALVAYAGQIGYNTPDTFAFEYVPEGTTVYVSERDGVRFDYRLVYVDTDNLNPDHSRKPELLLFLTDPQGSRITGAAVTYRLVGPRKTEVQARALPVRGGYGAGIYLNSSGPYRIATEVVTAKGTLNDKFAYEVL